MSGTDGNKACCVIELLKSPVLLASALVAILVLDRCGITARIEEISSTSIKLRQTALADADKDAELQQIAADQDDSNRGTSWFSRRRDLCPTRGDDRHFWPESNQQAEHVSLCAIESCEHLQQECDPNCPTDPDQCRGTITKYHEVLRICEEARDDCDRPRVTTDYCQYAKDRCYNFVLVWEGADRSCENLVAAERALRRYSTSNNDLAYQACLKPNSENGRIWIGNFQQNTGAQPWIRPQLTKVVGDTCCEYADISSPPDRLNLSADYIIKSNLIVYKDDGSFARAIDSGVGRSHRSRRMPMGVLPAGSHVRLLGEPQPQRGPERGSERAVQYWALVQVRLPSVCDQH
jgi:hypothetical protein